ncbi:MAG: glycosyltransferase family 2 protein, partial [Dehalococcoidia bacterium]
TSAPLHPSTSAPPLSCTVIIPARNESERIGQVIKDSQKHAGEVIVVDDASTDGTAGVARELGATVVGNTRRRGYIGAIKTGFQRASGDIVVTIDADGEHDPRDIPQLIKPISDGKADLVLGKREEISRISEKFINWLTSFKVKVADSGTGFRAIKRELAVQLKLTGKCTCGILVLEANHHGARTAEVPVSLRPVLKPRKIAWGHFQQIFYVLRWLIGW